jgi:hypothetical protein
MRWTHHNVNLQQAIAKSHCKRMSCSLDQEPCRSRGSRRRPTQMEGGTRACHRAQMEGRRPAVSSHEGGGSSPDPGSLRPMAARRRRGGAQPCHRVGGGASPDQAALASEVRIVRRQPLWYCGDATRREFYFCVTTLFHCKNESPFALPVGDGCHAYTVPPIAYLTLFCICDVVLKSV